MCSIRIFAKNIGDPYYEPTIVVHDNNNNMNKTANFSFLTNAHTSSFLLDITSGPILIAKKHQRVVFSQWMLLKA